MFLGDAGFQIQYLLPATNRCLSGWYCLSDKTSVVSHCRQILQILIVLHRFLPLGPVRVVSFLRLFFPVVHSFHPTPFARVPVYRQ